MMTHADILDSKYGSELLAFLLLAPARVYSSKELADRMGITEKSLDILLKEFLEDSIVRQFNSNKTRLYIVNHKHKLLPEIRHSLIKNQKPVEDDFSHAIDKLGDIKAAFLSGVLTAQEQLPVDLLLVGKVSLTKLDTFLKQCKQMLGLELNYSIMTPEEFTMRRDTFDRFIKDIFDYPHVVVVDRLTKVKKGTKK